MATATPERNELIRRDPRVMGGRPCFAGTRVPVRELFDNLAAGGTPESFVASHPQVSLAQVGGILRSVGQALDGPPGTAAGDDLLADLLEAGVASGPGTRWTPGHFAARKADLAGDISPRQRVEASEENGQ